MSEETSPAERYDLATQLIVQSPPGQVNDVISAIQVLVNDHTPEFKRQVLLRLREYHRAQLQGVTLEGANSGTLIADASRASTEPGEEDRYVDPRGGRSFTLDHFSLEVSDLRPHEIDEGAESFRSDLQQALDAYISRHYSDSESIGNVFCSARPRRVVKSVAPEAEGVKQEEGHGEKTEERAERAEGVNGGEVDDATAVQGQKERSEEHEQVSKEQEDEAVVVEGRSEEKAAVEPAQPEDTPEATTTDVEEEGPTSTSAGTGIVAAVQTAIVETVEEVKEVLSAETPAAAVGSGEPAAGEAPGEEKPEGVVEATSSDVAREGKQEELEEEAKQEDPTFTVCIVSNKYNTSNFWTGRWRSVWTIDPKADKLHGQVHIDVHYFEAGNVQLATSQTFDLPLPPDEAGRAGKIVNGIAKLEAEYQLKLAETNQQFGDKEFKSLRRALPITRTRVDWDKVSAYRLRSKA